MTRCCVSSKPPCLAGTADRVLDELRRQGAATLEGYRVARLDHALQSATRAERDGAEADWIVGALSHDIGDGLAPQNHDRLSAEVLRPFVRREVTWVVERHGTFRMLYYGEHDGWDENARERYRGHPRFDACSDFCARRDQSSFDPDYDSESLEHFAPSVREVFSRTASDPAVVREGFVGGLPASA